MSKNKIFNISDIEERQEYYERCEKRRRNGDNLMFLGLVIIGLGFYEVITGVIGTVEVRNYEKGLADGMSSEK